MNVVVGQSCVIWVYIFWFISLNKGTRGIKYILKLAKRRPLSPGDSGDISFPYRNNLKIIPDKVLAHSVPPTWARSANTMWTAVLRPKTTLSGRSYSPFWYFWRCASSSTWFWRTWTTRERWERRERPTLTEGIR